MKISEVNLDKATEEELNKNCNSFLNIHDQVDSDISEADREITKFIIQNSSRNSSGRLILQALWNEQVIHRLPNNYNLANNVLNSVFKKLRGDPEKLLLYDSVIKEQIDQGIIEKISNFHELKTSKNVSFLAHNGVFRMEHESTKCRVVNLSNLCERNKIGNLSLNQVSLPGPQLCNKLYISLILYRFNKYLFLYDLCKAFLQICLREEDTYKFLFLWYKDVSNSDFEKVCYRQLRVPFGTRFSPTLLIMALYIMLVLNANVQNSKTKEICNMLYNLSYMDNIAYSANDEENMLESYKLSLGIFSSYGFKLQKFSTNSPTMLNILSMEGLDISNSQVNLFGINWNPKTDQISIREVKLESECRTKREILKSLNSNFDPLGTSIPIFNRAKWFLHNLQINGTLGWDDQLDSNKIAEWRTICKSVNSFEVQSLDRFIGNYNHKYDLLGFTDASKIFLGCVLYLRNLETGSMHFLMGRNKIVSKAMESKTIPVLELLAVKFGTGVLHSMYDDLKRVFCPVDIRNLHIYTDSTISLNWIEGKTVKFSKMEKRGPTINNALDFIVEKCNKKTTFYHHIEGKNNPADVLTRLISGNILKRSCYLSGPSLENHLDLILVTVPNFGDNSNLIPSHVSCIDNVTNVETLISLNRFSSFKTASRVMHIILSGLYSWILKVKRRKSDLFKSCTLRTVNFHESTMKLISEQQMVNLKTVFDFFKMPLNQKIPPLVSQLNLFLDRHNVLRVKCKFDKLNAPFDERFPIFLPKKSELVRIIVKDLHLKLRHAGVYKVLTSLRKSFWLPSSFNVVKQILKSCSICKRLHGHTVKINQNGYRDTRINPIKIPFRDIAIDHIGPFIVRDYDERKLKVYILIFTCLWSRSVNLKVVRNIDGKCFMRSLQMHIFEYGMCRSVLSDNGSPIVSSIQKIQNILEEPLSKQYLSENGIEKLNFNPYPANASYLGGTVENLVKQVKNVLYCSISRNVVNIDDFVFLVSECNMLVNKRPVAYKRLLKPENSEENLSVITPEMLIRGYEVPSIDILPQYASDINDPMYLEDFHEYHYKIGKILKDIRNSYQTEFLETLRCQSTSVKNRYSPNDHNMVAVGDLVLIRSKFVKPYLCPLGLVKSVELNELGESTAVTIRKSNGETIRRHVSDIVILEKMDSKIPEKMSEIVGNVSPSRPKRKAANRCENFIKSLAKNFLV